VKFSAIKIAKMGILIALAVGLNFVLLAIPNVELISFVVFSSGYLLGTIEGGIVGLLAMFIYSVFNPMGMSTLPVLVAQIVSMTLIGISGGLVGRIKWFTQGKMVNFLLIGAIGFFLTLIYDFLTNLAWAYTSGQILPVLIGGTFLSLVHTISNAVIFAVLAPVIYKVKRLEVKSVYSEA
jgi:uncharacterized membrane protein